jgi:hypothetical protein
MSERTTDDPGHIWREQPEENRPVNLEHIVNRRTEELSSSTRSEILTSIGAALLLIAVMAWRLPVVREGLLEFAFAAAMVWVAISVYWFRRRIWPGKSSPRGSVAATGIEYYRAELERRRDHLKNEWLWHGPLFLAAIVFIAVVMGRANIVFQPLRNVLPLVILLAAWTGFGLWRRRRQAGELQREIDEIDSLHTEDPGRQ